MSSWKTRPMTSARAARIVAGVGRTTSRSTQMTNIVGGRKNALSLVSRAMPKKTPVSRAHHPDARDFSKA